MYVRMRSSLTVPFGDEVKVGGVVLGKSKKVYLITIRKTPVVPQGHHSLLIDRNEIR